MQPPEHEQQAINRWNEFNERLPSDVKSEKSNSKDRDKNTKQSQRIHTTTDDTDNDNEGNDATTPPFTRSTAELNVLITSNQKRSPQLAIF